MSNKSQLNVNAITTFSVGALVRVALYSLPSLSSVLDGRVEITTPVSSFKRMQEGLFLYTTKSISNKLNVYDGDVFHQSPLLLALFSTVKSFNLSLQVPYLLADLLAAFGIYIIASKISKSTGTKWESFPPWAAAAIYLFNPFSLLSSIAQSTNVFSNTLIILSTAAALTNSAVLSMALLALATIISLYPLVLVPPMIAIALSYPTVMTGPIVIEHGGKSIGSKGSELSSSVEADSKIISSSTEKESELDEFIQLAPFSENLFIPACWAKLVVGYLLYVGIFLYLSFLTAGSNWKFLDSVYSPIIFLEDLTPNIGLWWYFFVEMFTYFRPFFIAVFQLFVAGFSIPITIRFISYPLYALVAVIGIVTTFKSYPEVGDLGLYLSFWALLKPILSQVKYKLVVVLTLLYASALAPTFYHLWIYLGSGNSNFFYAITLVYALGISISLSDSTWTALRLEYDGGKNPRLSQI